MPLYILEGENMLKTSIIKFGIRIVTYPRSDGNTPLLLRKTIDSVMAQSYSNWVVYLAGDAYEPAAEFNRYESWLPKDKVRARNIFAEPERHKFKDERWRLYGGISAINKCLDWMSEEGISHVAILDHDDIWKENHLKCLFDAYNQFPEASFVYTAGTHASLGLLPRARSATIAYDNMPPMEEDMLHSSASWRLDKIPLRYRYGCRVSGEPQCGDMTMWQDMKAYLRNHNMKSYFVDKETVFHDGM